MKILKIKYISINLRDISFLKVRLCKISSLVSLVFILLIGCGKEDEDDPIIKVERVMKESPLMSGLPVENRAFDPEFYLEQGLPMWFMEKISDGYETCENFSRVTLKKLPAGRHALLIKGTAFNKTGCIAWGSYLLGVPAVKVSIWAAHEQQTLIEDLDVKVSYFDPTEGNGNVYQNLSAIESSKLTIDNLTWIKLEGIIPASAQGWADLQVTQTSSDNLLINGFVVQDVDSMYFDKRKKVKPIISHKLTSAMKTSLKNRESMLSK